MKRLASVLICLCLVLPAAALASTPNDPLAGPFQAFEPTESDFALFDGHEAGQAQSVNLVLTQWTEFVDSRGEWGARGQIRNTGSERIWFGKIKVDLVDKWSGNFVSNEYAYINGEMARTSNGTTTYTTLAPGDTATFDIEYTGQQGSAVRAGGKQFAWSTYASQPLLTNVNLTQLTEYSYRNEWAGRGMVQNTGGDWSYFNKVHVDMFDGVGNYIGDDYNYIDGQNGTINDVTTDTALAPGSSGSFNIRWTGIPWGDVERIRTRVWWTER